MSVEQYKGASTICGPLRPNTGKVEYRTLLSRRDKTKVAVIGAAHAAVVLGFITYLAWPSHLPALRGHSLGFDIASVLGVVAIILLQVIQLIGTASTLHFAYRAKDPVPMVPEPGLRVAMLTTIVPTKEPWETAEKTMLKFLDQTHDGTVDAWVLDEGDDPYIRQRCAELGFRHFSRKGVPAWNQESGPFRAKTKHGNHNAWRQAHEHEYDVVTQMDPDHTPLDSDDFLLRVLGYFSDPDVAFVVAPQAYGNAEDGLVAKGSGELAYLFHGVTQRGANALGAPVLIGTNHAFRPAAWQQIGGYQDCIIEDHLTAMRIPTEVNPATGNRWKGVYTSDVLTTGDGPATWTDFFSQQKRWAYGIFEILTSRTPGMLKKLSWGQRVSFLSLQSFYPSVSVTWLLGNFLSALYLVGGITSSRLHLTPWLSFFAVSMALGLSINFWLRRFNLMPHERTSWGMTGLLLNLVTTPVYLQAGFEKLTGRRLGYKVTAKGRLSSGDTLQTFRLQLGWAAFAVVCMALGLLQHHLYPSLYVWMSLTLVYSLTPIALWQHSARRARSALRSRTAAPRIVRQGRRVTLPETALVGASIGAADARLDREIISLLDSDLTEQRD